MTGWQRVVEALRWGWPETRDRLLYCAAAILIGMSLLLLVAIVLAAGPGR